ncbi:hypothetical protein [Nocardioides sp. SYSU D00038]|uniref:hypothetical protein n=1 Tax=Nocardioides sp. SYSU D00038 TaxID=2812554 RepID=UPI001967C23F|nr:hypothetical protein [Nocardioides sp. SYSU D00038]
MHPLRTAATRRPVRLLAGLALAGTVLAGCGGDDEPTPAPTPAASAADPTPAPAGGLVVTDGTTPEELLGCLTDAGLAATAQDSVPFGVEVPVAGVEVAPMSGRDGTQGADLWVFADPTAAEDNRSTITLADADTPTSWVAGNVVARLYYPAGDDPEVTALRACLPG